MKESSVIQMAVCADLQGVPRRFAMIEIKGAIVATIIDQDDKPIPGQPFSVLLSADRVAEFRAAGRHGLEVIAERKFKEWAIPLGASILQHDEGGAVSVDKDGTTVRLKSGFINIPGSGLPGADAEATLMWLGDAEVERGPTPLFDAGARTELASLVNGLGLIWAIHWYASEVERRATALHPQPLFTMTAQQFLKAIKSGP